MKVTVLDNAIAIDPPLSARQLLFTPLLQKMACRILSLSRANDGEQVVIHPDSRSVPVT